MANLNIKKNSSLHGNQPIDVVSWLHVDQLHSNNYNPNWVAPPELELLAISIIEDGWTQPIVITADHEIVDGYHRYLTCKKNLKVYKMTGGLVPTVMIAPSDISSQMMSTIRHNRARGTHAVLEMSKIIQQMVEVQKLEMKEICERLQMEPEEVIRLAARCGIPQTRIIGSEWSTAWVPKKFSDYPEEDEIGARGLDGS